MIKITPADKWFSSCVRIRTNWTCEYAGTYFPDPTKRMGLHCSHYKGRGNWSVRFDPVNAFSHSYGSHSKFESNPDEFRLWVISQIGEGSHELLLERANDIYLGREYRKANKLKEGRTTVLAAHYRREFERMEEMRNDGVIDRIEFEAFL